MRIKNALGSIGYKLHQTTTDNIPKITNKVSQYSLGVVLDDAGEALDADVLEVVAVRADEAADRGGGRVQQHRVRVDRSHRLHHLVHCRCVVWGRDRLEKNKDKINTGRYR